MQLSLSNSLSRTRRSGLDPDASAYISLVQAAGVDETQLATLGFDPWPVTAPRISKFFKDEKDAGRWDGLKRLYLPVWGIAAANAICIKSLTSGTFVGGVTHGAGFVQGDGSTGSFVDSSTVVQMGLTNSANGLFFLSYGENAVSGLSGYVGNRTNSSNTLTLWHISDTALRFDSGLNGSSVTVPKNNMGIVSGNRVGTNVRTSRRVASGYTTLSNATSDVGNIEGAGHLFYMKTQSPYSSAPMGAYGANLGFSVENDEAFTLNLKTLWENLTGLALP